MAPIRRSPGTESRATSQTSSHHAADTHHSINESRQVAWWPVHEYVESTLHQVGHWPMLGTPQWCRLDDNDPRKLAALFDAARHWALRLETCQEAYADASKAVSAAADWKAWRPRPDCYIERKTAS